MSYDKVVSAALVLGGLLVSVNLLAAGGAASDADVDGGLEAESWSPYTIMETDDNGQMMETHDLVSGSGGKDSGGGRAGF